MHITKLVVQIKSCDNTEDSNLAANLLTVRYKYHKIISPNLFQIRYGPTLKSKLHKLNCTEVSLANIRLVYISFFHQTIHDSYIRFNVECLISIWLCIDYLAYSFVLYLYYSLTVAYLLQLAVYMTSVKYLYASSFS